MPVVEGARGVRFNAGVPGAGTSAVQTLTIGGTPTGGTMKFSFEGLITGAITWSATNATLLANMNAAFDARYGTGSIVAAAGTLTAGIGTVTLTFGGNYAARAVSLISVAENALTGTAPTLAIANTTPGVDAAGRGAPKGALMVDETNGTLYQNTGTASAPTWTSR